MMTKLPRTRGRLVVVAIFADAPKVDLFRFFWRELRLCGIELRLIRTWIDGEQQLTHLQVGAVLEVTLEHTAGDLRRDSDRLERPASSDFVEVCRHVA